MVAKVLDGCTLVLCLTWQPEELIGFMSEIWELDWLYLIRLWQDLVRLGWSGALSFFEVTTMLDVLPSAFFDFILALDLLSMSLSVLDFCRIANIAFLRANSRSGEPYFVFFMLIPGMLNSRLSKSLFLELLANVLVPTVGTF